MAILLVVANFPLYHQNAKAADAGNRLTYKFEGFSNNEINDFSFNGDAEIPTGMNLLRLTPAVALKSGAVFHKTPVYLQNDYSFSTVFSFRMSNSNPVDGISDGLTFTIQTKTSSARADGGGLGYYDIKPSFTVKYDTFKNDVYQDPSANYIGIAQNGELGNKQASWYTDLDQYNTANSTNYVLSDGTLYYTWIDYDGRNKNIQVHLGTSPDRANSHQILDVNGIDLGALFNGSPIHAGFTAATGYPNYETHDIYRWYFADDYAPIDYAQNRPPTASEDNVTTEEDTPVSGAVNGTDPDGDPLAYTKGEDPKHGVVTLNPDGTWTYTPEKGFVGEDSFTVIVDDGYGGTTEVTITVDVTESNTPSPPNACGPRVALINGSFEQPLARNVGDKGSPGAEHAWMYFYDYEVPAWETTATDHFIQIMQNSNEFLGPNLGGNGQTIPVVAADGTQYAELNANQVSMLYQDVETTPGQIIYWRLAHRGEYGVDTMQLRIGSPDIPPLTMPVIQQMSSTNNKWTYYSGTYTVPQGQTVTRFGFEGVTSSNGDPTFGNLLDDIFLGTEPCGIVTKSVDKSENVQSGDNLTYTVNFKNEGGDVAEHVVLEDQIPEGTEYVPDSLEIIDGPNTGPLTDESGDDQGEFDEDANKIIVRLGSGATEQEGGRVPNTDILPEGTTIQFKVKVLPESSGKQVINKAVANYDNLLENKNETLESNEVDSSVNLNQPPIVSDDNVTTEKDTPVSGKVNGTDPDGDPLTYTKGKDPEHGNVTVNPDGTWTYTPETGFVGEDSFTVIVDDGKGGKTEVTITVDVTESNTPPPPTNQKPTVPDYNLSTRKNSPLEGTVEGRDPDEDSLTYRKGEDPEHGTVTVNPDGTWTYEPDPDYVGPDSFTVIVDDGKGGTTTSTITIEVEEPSTPPPVNRPPTAPDYSETTDNETPATGKVRGTDPDGDPLTYTKGEDPKHGTVTVNPDGTWTYEPDPGYVGEDSFTVIVDDGNGGTTEVTITIDVTDPVTSNPPPDPEENRPPTAPDYSETTDNETPATGKVRGTDPDGDPLTYTKGEDPEHGTVTVNPDGTWTYEPDPGYVGEDSFTVIVDDGNGGTTEVTITIDVTDPVTSNPPPDPEENRPPTAPDYSETTDNETPATGKVRGTDPDDDPLTYTKGEDPKHGTVTVNPDGTWTYEPDPGYVGEDSFTVIVDDGNGGTTEVTITIDVTDPVTSNPPPDPEENRPPTAPDYSETTDNETPATGKVKGTDPDGDPLTYTKGEDPKHGTVTVNPDGTWTYEPDPGYVGEDSFTVIVDDGNGGTTEVTITIDVKEPSTPPPTPTPDPEENRPPTAPDYSETTDNETPATGKVKGTDPDGDPLTYTKGEDPKHGTVTVNPDGTWTYEPDPGYVGEDSFTVIVDDGNGGTTEVTITIEVKKPSTPTTPPGSSTEGRDRDRDRDRPSTSNGQQGTPPEVTTPPSSMPDQPSSTPHQPSMPDQPSSTPDQPPSMPDQPSSTPDQPPGMPTPPQTTSTPPQAGHVAGAQSEQGTELPSVEPKGGKKPQAKDGEQPPNRLPNTSTNLYNLGFTGAIAMLAGWLLRRKKSKPQ
ncbi:Ig-like domain-containing protein [Brevibacillus panacihumi]|nr:Ig-like domain-containing protein [Brevibacillus panacihumi]